MPENSKSSVIELESERPLRGAPTKVSLSSGQAYRIKILPPRCWIKIKLDDVLGRPAAGEIYRIELPDGTLVREDKLDQDGSALVEGLSSEECIISFPRLDLSAWSYLGSSE
jgi:hypothetical protein